MYNPTITQPMREELTRNGVKELTSSQQVNQSLSNEKGSYVVLVNSVCGCSAASARPALIESLKNPLTPQKIYTVFAGVDMEATEEARKYFEGYAPSSPSIAFFKDQQLIYMIERHQIEGFNPASLLTFITSIYDKFYGEKINESIQIKDPSKALEMTPEEVKEKLKKKEIKLLDSRAQWERKKAFIEGSEFLNEAYFQNILKNWSKDTLIVLYCHQGKHSHQAVRFFNQQGFTNVFKMTGGIQAWSEKIDQQVPKY